MSRLRRDANIPVFLISGNHDATSKITKALSLPENVHRFKGRNPSTKRLDSISVAVHGVGYSDSAETDNLATNYPDAIAGYYNIGVLHTSLTGSEGHDTYAPCTLEDLKAKFYDYWALGHIHKREILSGSPYVVYPGNIQGRSIRETSAKGCYIVEVVEAGTTQVRFEELDVVRWAEVVVDMSPARSEAHSLELIESSVGAVLSTADGRLLAARIVLKGATEAAHSILPDIDRFDNEIRSAICDHFGDAVWVEKINVGVTTPLDRVALLTRDDAWGALFRSIDEAIESDDNLRTLIGATADDFASIQSSLGPEATIRPSDAALQRVRLKEAEGMLLAALSAEDGSQ